MPAAPPRWNSVSMAPMPERWNGSMRSDIAMLGVNWLPSVSEP
jgi:hypothetical protein